MIFPYLSLYILIFSFICFILFIVVPCPYGKFSYDAPLPISPDFAWSLMNLSTLICIFGYWDIENGKWNSQVPNMKGWICLSFFIIHFIWRGLISVLWINLIHSEENYRGTKKTSFLLVLVAWLYYPVVGMLIRHMCVSIDEKIDVNDFLFLICCIIFLFLNAYVDIYLNYKRKISQYTTTANDTGTYLTKQGMREHFTILFNLGIENPNYFFEIIEWGFFTLLTMRFESLWWFVATLFILLPRSLWSSHWLTEVNESGKTQNNGFKQNKSKKIMF